MNNIIQSHHDAMNIWSRGELLLCRVYLLSRRVDLLSRWGEIVISPDNLTSRLGEINQHFLLAPLSVNRYAIQ